MPVTPPDNHRQTSPCVYLETFGCQMNVLDSQLVQGQLRALGYHFVDDWKSADVVLYNTCSVRDHAEHKVYSRLGRVAQHKTLNKHLLVGVIGCMAEREGVDLIRRYPQIDLLCGPGELDQIPMLIDNALKTAPHTRRTMKDKPVALQGNTHRRSSTLGAAEDRLELLDLARSFSPDEHHGSAYVRITRGCNKFCTYCVVPNTRGAEIHRPPDHIVEECKKLVDCGVVEITLLGQTVNHYHFDHGAAISVDGLTQPQVGGAPCTDDPHLSGRRVTRFSDLLARIHDEIPALQRLRFVTSFPRDFGDDILQVIRDKPRICRYLHLPVQSGSNRILKLMNRGYSVEEYVDLLHRVRTTIPEAQIASDIICGFPTEIEADHQATCDLLRQSKFKNCFIFKYSPRPGTAAIERFVDDVPEDIKRQRNNDLLAIQSQVSTAVHAQYTGQTVRVFVESLNKRTKKRQNHADPAVTVGWEPEKTTCELSGRTDGDLIVSFEGEKSMIGTIVDVHIESALSLTLIGRTEAEPTTA